MATGFDDALARRKFDDALARQAAGDLDGAEAGYRAVLAAVPAHPGALNNLANVLRAKGRAEAAVPLLQRAFAADPGDPTPLFNLGAVQLEAGRPAPAAAALQTALRLHPGFAAGWLNLGQALDALGADGPAEAAFAQATALAPGDPAVLRATGAVALARGDWAAGWPAWTARWLDPVRLVRRAGIGLPVWAPDSGGPGMAGPVLVWGEQGLGEEILLSGLVDRHLAALPDPVVEVDPRLLPLVRRARPGWRLIGRGEPHGCVAEVPFGDLALLAPADPPPIPPRLVPDPARAAALRAAVDAAARDPTRPRIGLGWSSPKAPLGGLKSLRLADLAPVLALPATFVVLQYGAVEAEVAAVRAATGADVLCLPDPDRTDDLDGLAALIAGLDRVVTTSSTTAHLAAALGVPTRVMVPRGAGRYWYWGRSGETVPWYPAVRLFRQGAGASLAALAATVAAAVAAAEDGPAGAVSDR